jgi:hypothetical protein
MRTTDRIKKGVRVPARYAGAHVRTMNTPRSELDPSFYEDIDRFRAAVMSGTIDISRGCRNMAEYQMSFSL